MKRIESLLKIGGMKFEFSKLEIRFHKRQVSRFCSSKPLGINAALVLMKTNNNQKLGRI